MGVAGHLFQTRYRVQAVLGKSPTGLVMSAIRLDNLRPVTIEIFEPELSRDDRARARFALAAEASRKLKSEYTAQVVEHGLSNKNCLYLVTEPVGAERSVGRMRDGDVPPPTRMRRWGARSPVRCSRRLPRGTSGDCCTAGWTPEPWPW